MTTSEKIKEKIKELMELYNDINITSYQKIVLQEMVNKLDTMYLQKIKEETSDPFKDIVGFIEIQQIPTTHISILNVDTFKITKVISYENNIITLDSYEIDIENLTNTIKSTYHKVYKLNINDYGIDFYQNYSYSDERNNIYNIISNNMNDILEEIFKIGKKGN